MSTVNEITDKISPVQSSPLSNFKSLSPTLSHVYKHYPIIKETSDALLQVKTINYFVTFTVSLYLDFKTAFLDKYFTFMNEIINFIDDFIKNWIFIKVIDYWFPFLSGLHLSHFYITNQFENLKVITQKITNWFESIFNPVIAPVMKYVNGRFEYAIDTFLPKSTVVSANNTDGIVLEQAETIKASEAASRTEHAFDGNDDSVSENKGTKGVEKFVELTGVALDRVQPLIKEKITTIKSVPKDIQNQVTKSSNELAKSLGLKKSGSLIKLSTEENNESLVDEAIPEPAIASASGVSTTGPAGKGSSTVEVSA